MNYNVCRSLVCNKHGHRAGVAAGTIQLNASSGNLSAQYVIADQPALTISGSFLSLLNSHEVVGPATAATTVNESAPASEQNVPVVTSTSSLLNSAPSTPLAANQSTTMVSQSAPLIISNTTVHIVDTVFDSNQRFDFGGMIVMNGAAVTISNTRFNNLHGRVAGAALVTSGSLVMLNQGSSVTGNSGSCLAGAILVKSGSALYLEDATFANNNAMGDRGGGAVLLYDNSTLHAVNTVFTQNAATAANLYAVDADAMAGGATPSDVAVPSLWCGAVGGVAGIDTLYGINDLASNHLLGSGKCAEPTYNGAIATQTLIQAVADLQIVWQSGTTACTEFESLPFSLHCTNMRGRKLLYVTSFWHYQNHAALPVLKQNFHKMRYGQVFMISLSFKVCS